MPRGLQQRSIAGVDPRSVIESQLLLKGGDPGAIGVLRLQPFPNLHGLCQVDDHKRHTDKECHRILFGQWFVATQLPVSAHFSLRTIRRSPMVDACRRRVSSGSASAASFAQPSFRTTQEGKDINRGQPDHLSSRRARVRRQLLPPVSRLPSLWVLRQSASRCTVARCTSGSPACLSLWVLLRISDAYRGRFKGVLWPLLRKS